MESKKINRQFNSLFWGFIYSMPLLILLITYVGYFNFYKENQTFDITSEDKYSQTIKSEFAYLKCGVQYDYIDFNYNDKPVDYFYDYISNANLEFFDLTLGPQTMKDVYVICVFDDLTTNHTMGIGITIMQGHYVLFSIDLMTMENVTIAMFGPNVNNWETIPTYDNIKALSTPEEIEQVLGFTFPLGEKNEELIDLVCGYHSFYIYEFVEHKDNLLIENTIIKGGAITSYYSLFDLSLIHTIDTFDGFVFEPLYNVTTDILPKIGFNNSTLISQMVILFFVWFVQGMLLHIIIDTLTLIPKMYHKLMERWLG